MMYGWIIGLVLIVILFAAVRRSGVFKRRPDTTVNNSSTSTPLETLKNRYAKGEIDDEEFEKRKKELEKAG
ncbi:SHOCT domain-containing protein [Psychroflexus sp. CAK57W]|uniref:SHOCT domain-containing protein n=1 Tax=Psychroflexus curvus TaxID=2873595 RepID=UPI001CCB5EC4|nr:SHOCT domain-containing protein [Psychroflexus curvus]MBZ9786822.1 SHOCT domain-containing protein [Psychroflexus curvus]